MYINSSFFSCPGSEKAFLKLSLRDLFADIFSHHVEGKQLDKTVWSLLNFYAYVKYHVKVKLHSGCLWNY